MPSKIDSYNVSKTLGSGISAKVKLATAQDGTRVALKIFDKNNPQNTQKALETLKHEVDVYKNLQHPYMVKLLDFKDSATWKKSDGREVPVAYMALELIQGGELFDYVAIRAFKEDICRYYFKQMLQVMHYMHIKGVAHRDLKPENIMLDDQFNVRFADFGFAAPIQGRDGSGFLKTILGTTAYMAPELITKQAYQGHCVDLFALGIILFILYSGHPPFNQAHPNDPHYKLLATNRADLFWHQHSNSGGKPKGFFSEEFKDLITNMLQLRPEARPSLADCVGHAWMQGPIASAESVRSEFHNRAKTIKAEQAAEAAKKASARQTHTTNKGVRRGESINGKTFISEGVEVAQQEESKDNVVMIQLEKYQNVQSTNTELYSTYEPEFIFSQIISKLQDKDIQPSLKEHKCKMTYEVYKDVKEEENYEELPQQGVRVAISILKLDDSRVCIEFRRLEGASWFFYEHFQTMKAALSGINDAVAAE